MKIITQTVPMDGRPEASALKAKLRNLDLESLALEGKKKQENEKLASALRDRIRGHEQLDTENRCRRVGCSRNHQPSPKSGNKAKDRSAIKLFCDADSGIKNQLKTRDFQRLVDNNSLGVAV